jgi:DNA-binding transcriptional LysR family regulator
MAEASRGPLPHLETFCKAAELQNFTAAADALCLTQAAVSQRIRALEQDTGAALFQRQAGRVHLTPAGQTLYDYARRILALHCEARAALGQVAADLCDELRLAASSVPGEHLLPALLQEFQTRHPRVQVMATVGDSATVLEALEAGQVAVALVGRPGPAAWAESRPFARDRLVLVVAPGHPWAGAAAVTLDELRAEPLLLREPGSASRACFEEGLRRHGRGLGEFRVGMQLGSNEAIKEAVLRRSGVAVLSALAVRQDVTTGRLRALDVTGLGAVRDLYVVLDRRRGLPPAVRAFLEVVEASPFTAAVLPPASFSPGS